MMKKKKIVSGESNYIKSEKNRILIIQYKILIIKYLVSNGESKVYSINHYLNEYTQTFSPPVFYVAITDLIMDENIEIVEKKKKEVYRATAKGVRYLSAVGSFYLETFHVFNSILDKLS